MRAHYASFVAKESVGRNIQDLCHRMDLPIVQTHIKEVLQTGNDTVHSPPYRLQVGSPDIYIPVKAQSRLFCSHNETDFIMIVHTVISDAGLSELENHMSNTNLSLPSSSHQNTLSSMGGPLMTSTMNGSLLQPNTNRSNHVVPSFSSPPSSSDNANFFQNDPFDFEFQNATFEMDTVGSVWDTRPDSRASVTPVSTPRPPSVTAYSPVAAPVCPSPLTSSYHNSVNNSGGQQSPQNNNNNNNNSNNNLNNTGYSNTNTFPFQNYEDNKNDNKIQEQIQNQQQQQQQHEPSEKLRNLLTKRPHSNASSLDEIEQKNRILKGLLIPDDDKDALHNKLGTSSRVGPSGGQRRPGDSKPNNMLLQLLNEKNSDEDELDRRPNRTQSELMRQLQKVCRI